MSTLDQRISTAFEPGITSVGVAQLICEVEAAGVAAGELAQRARERALDPLVAPDQLTAAREESEHAAFTRQPATNPGSVLRVECDPDRQFLASARCRYRAATCPASPPRRDTCARVAELDFLATLLLRWGTPSWWCQLSSFIWII
jgi:hypothetical protein